MGWFNHQLANCEEHRGVSFHAFSASRDSPNISDEIQAASEHESTAGSPQIHRGNWKGQIIFHQTFMALGFMGVLYFHAIFFLH